MIESENRHKITFEGKEISLIGTAHVSEESADLVAAVIQEERPDTVCVELCESRYQAMIQENRWKETDLIKVIREKKAFLLLSNLMLASFQKKIGKRLGIRPGAEMLRAIQAAKTAGAQIHLVDRDIRTTLSRAWRLMGLWTKIKLLAQLLVSFGDVEDIEKEDIEKMKQKDVLEALLAELGDILPELRRVLIDERDLYLAAKIRTAPGKRIVAVVGAGHVPGIQAHWHKPVDVAALEVLPPKGKVMGFLKWAIPVFVVGLIGAGFFMSGAEAGSHMIKWWVLANGLFAGAGALLALAHPLTILTAVAASPITSLNPMIAAGWVAGLVEIFLRKPKVKDFEQLPEDIGSVRGFWKNKITRVLLIVVLTNMGSSLGAFMALPLMARVF
ncbi:MAG: TraB/GumN family protein [Deltaproteobacteria bacterium]|nr:TraB/GumN family protein [Deltaproteobacteria bacterium]OQX65847.1 MAG: conjugal transfer protein TraB [Desulfococcus sp. 4484_242]